MGLDDFLANPCSCILGEEPPPPPIPGQRARQGTVRSNIDYDATDGESIRTYLVITALDRKLAMADYRFLPCRLGFRVRKYLVEFV